MALSRRLVAATYQGPGNIRALESTVRRAGIIASGRIIGQPWT
jgi:DNA-binding NtrC family response regulator